MTHHHLFFFPKKTNSIVIIWFWSSFFLLYFKKNPKNSKNKKQSKKNIHFLPAFLVLSHYRRDPDLEKQLSWHHTHSTSMIASPYMTHHLFWLSSSVLALFVNAFNFFLVFNFKFIKFKWFKIYLWYCFITFFFYFFTLIFMRLWHFFIIPVSIFLQPFIYFF